MAVPRGNVSDLVTPKETSGFSPGSVMETRSPQSTPLFLSDVIKSASQAGTFGSFVVIVMTRLYNPVNFVHCLELREKGEPNSLTVSCTSSYVQLMGMCAGFTTGHCSRWPMYKRITFLVVFSVVFFVVDENYFSNHHASTVNCFDFKILYQTRGACDYFITIKKYICTP